MNLLSRRPCILAKQMSIASLRDKCLELIQGDDRGASNGVCVDLFCRLCERNALVENTQKAEFLQLEKLRMIDVWHV